MRVKRGETSPFRAGQVSLVSPWFHPLRVKREIGVNCLYIKKNNYSFSPFTLFTPPPPRDSILPICACEGGG